MFNWLFQRHLEEDEPLYLAVHRHWLFGAYELAMPTLAFLVSWLLLYAAPIRQVAVFVLLLDCAIAVWFVRNFFDYFLDAWLITDRAVIDIEWHGWFHRTSTRIDYGSIEGVSYEIKGILGTLFRFGNVTIERIGGSDDVSIESVPRPRDVESAVLACQEACVRAKNLKDSSHVKDILSELVAERIHMHDLEEEEEEVNV